jgi:hypothetical protein
MTIEWPEERCADLYTLIGGKGSSPSFEKGDAEIYGCPMAETRTEAQDTFAEMTPRFQASDANWMILLEQRWGEQSGEQIAEWRR